MHENEEKKRRWGAGSKQEGASVKKKKLGFRYEIGAWAFRGQVGVGSVQVWAGSR